MPVDTLGRTFKTNFFGLVDLTQRLLPLLCRSNNSRIGNQSSILGSLTEHSDPNKTAVNAFTVHLAKVLRGSSIKVNSAHPGSVRTGMNPIGDLNVEEAETAVDSQRSAMTARVEASFVAGQDCPGERNAFSIGPLIQELTRQGGPVAHRARRSFPSALKAAELIRVALVRDFDSLGWELSRFQRRSLPSSATASDHCPVQMPPLTVAHPVYISEGGSGRTPFPREQFRRFPCSVLSRPVLQRSGEVAKCLGVLNRTSISGFQALLPLFEAFSAAIVLFE